MENKEVNELIKSLEKLSKVLGNKIAELEEQEKESKKKWKRKLKK